jgi:hypothetical protein
VEKTVTITLNVPLILAILQLEFVKTFQTTMHVTITMHVPLIDVLLKDASIPTKIVTIMMHVPETFVMLLPENVLLLLLFANLLSVKLENAIARLDVKPLIETVMMELHVLLIPAVKIVDATMLLMMHFVTTKMLAPLINVTLNVDVSTPEWLVTITILAPPMFVSMEIANSSMHANKATNAPFLLVMQLLDANPLQETVMTETHVLLILAILLSDASTLLFLVLPKMLASSLTAAQSRDANPNQRTVTTRIHAPKIVV